MDEQLQFNSTGEVLTCDKCGKPLMGEWGNCPKCGDDLCLECAVNWYEPDGICESCYNGSDKPLMKEARFMAQELNGGDPPIEDDVDFIYNRLHVFRKDLMAEMDRKHQEVLQEAEEARELINKMMNSLKEFL